MKTKTNIRKVLISAALWGTAFISGSFLNAQPSPGVPEFDELSFTMERLESLMATFEESIKYVAPSGEEEDLTFTMERLEFLASQIENNIKYHAPDFESIPVKSSKKSDSRDLLSQTKKTEAVDLKN